MAGDRRATAGNLISHRTMEKVFPADRYSAAWPSPARPGRRWRWCKLFQLQLEHYEKVEGSPPQPRGQGQPARRRWSAATCRAAMQGLVVVPIFAGYDMRRGDGRLFQYDVTGGRYEERDYVATGSGSLHAGTVVKVGYRRRMTRDEAVDLVLPGAVRGGRRGLRHRRPRPGARHLPRRRHHRRRRLPARVERRRAARSATQRSPNRRCAEVPP